MAQQRSYCAAWVIGGIAIVSTLNHPFYANGAYTNAEFVNVGDSILTATNNWLYVSDKDILAHETLVYNIDTEGNDNYFVGDKAVLVHNFCPFKTVREKMAANFPDLFNRIINSELSTAFRGHLYRKLEGFTDAQLLRFSDEFATNPAALKKMESLVEEGNPAKLNKFLDDFIDDVDGLRGISGDPDLVDAWKILEGLELSIRTTINNLKLGNKLRAYGFTAIETKAIVKNLNNAGPEYNFILEGLIATKYDEVVDLKKLLSKFKSNSASLYPSVRQAFNKIDELIDKGYDTSRIRVEHDGLTTHDVDVGIMKLGLTDEYEIAFQFKTLEGGLNAKKIKDASKQLKADKKVVEIRCKADVDLEKINSEVIMKEMRYQSKFNIDPTKGSQIDEFHYILSNNEKIIIKVADM